MQALKKNLDFLPEERKTLTRRPRPGGKMKPPVPAAAAKGTAAAQGTMSSAEKSVSGGAARGEPQKGPPCSRVLVPGTPNQSQEEFANRPRPTPTHAEGEDFGDENHDEGRLGIAERDVVGSVGHEEDGPPLLALGDARHDDAAAELPAGAQSAEISWLFRESQRFDKEWEEVAGLLAQSGLDRYSSVLRENGFDSLESLHEADETVLGEIGMPPSPCARLLAVLRDEEAAPDHVRGGVVAAEKKHEGQTKRQADRAALAAVEEVGDDDVEGAFSGGVRQHHAEDAFPPGQRWQTLGRAPPGWRVLAGGTAAAAGGYPAPGTLGGLVAAVRSSAAGPDEAMDSDEGDWFVRPLPAVEEDDGPAPDVDEASSTPAAAGPEQDGVILFFNEGQPASTAAAPRPEPPQQSVDVKLRTSTPTTSRPSSSAGSAKVCCFVCYRQVHEESALGPSTSSEEDGATAGDLQELRSLFTGSSIPKTSAPRLYCGEECRRKEEERTASARAARRTRLQECQAGVLASSKDPEGSAPATTHPSAALLPQKPRSNDATTTAGEDEEQQLEEAGETK